MVVEMGFDRDLVTRVVANTPEDQLELEKTADALLSMSAHS
jgi:hypothetical protein